MATAACATVRLAQMALSVVECPAARRLSWDSVFHPRETRGVEMLEALWAAGTIALLWLLVALVRLVSLEALLWPCGVMILSGLALGVPTGVQYHLVLRRGLKASGALPKRWWLNPTALHKLLSPLALRSLQPWFSLGALGFVLAMIGCVVLSVAVIIAFRQL